MSGFFQKYFLDPIIYGTGYNPVNTVVYIALLLGLLFLTIRLFQRLEIELDRRFYSFFLLFLFLGSGLRVLRDMEILTSNLFKTPGIYALIYVLFIASLLLGILLQRLTDLPYFIVPFTVGGMASLYTLSQILGLGPKPGPLLFVLPVSALITLILILLVKRRSAFLEDRINQGILFSHMLDASSTYLGITSYGLVAQHVLPKALISWTHPAVMYPLKLAVVLPALYLLEDFEKGTVREVVKALLLTIGLAPGMRDLLMIMVVS
jgi:uncharacterized membrane protein